MNASTSEKAAPQEKILIICQYFPPDMASTGQVIAELATDLASYGKDVTVIADRTNYYSECSYKEYDSVVKVKRVGLGYFNKDKALGRISSYVTFTTLAMLQFRLFRSADKVIVVSNPPTLSVLCAPIRMIFGKPVYFMLQDLYPDLAIHLGYTSPRGIMSTVMYALNRIGFARAEKIVVLGEAMRKHFIEDPHYRKWADKTVIIPNWEDPKQSFPAPKDNPWSKARGYDHQFVVLYSGNIGLIQDLDAIIEAADILKDQKDIVFLFGGEGGKKLSLMEKVSQKNLHNVSFLGYVSSGEYNDLLATADCDIVALKPGMDSFGFPVKTYSYMASGRPIIAVTEAENELYRTVRDNDIGISVTDGRSLAEAILRLKNDPALSARLGHNGRSVLLEKFSRAIATKKYCDLIDGEI